MDGLKCVVCGGTEFNNQDGFYYCAECQTQAAGIQENELEYQFGDGQRELGNRSRVASNRSSTSSTNHKSEQITSYECYNYILLGLVNELIELGAHANLKPIVQTIWFKYLKQIEVIHKDVKKPPALPAFNYKHDASVLYGRAKKHKVAKRKRSRSCSSADSDGFISQREQTRLKKKMAKELDKTQQSKSPLKSTLMNQSLASLKSNTSDKTENFLTFSKSAKQELHRHMTKKHLEEHIEDVDVELSCHNLSYRSVTSTYASGPNVMNQNKLYVFLYLALLIQKDDIHLGDMLRFVHEGSLSYNHYQHFFPEDLDSQTDFISTFRVSKITNHGTCRHEAGKLCEFLELHADVPKPNIVKLIARYCKELNLPNQIGDVCVNFVAQFEPTMKARNNFVPNYEAQAMCVIIFVLKLLFGLDDLTEIHLSTFAGLLNEADDANREEMFDFMGWLHTLAYRRYVLVKHHFPTAFVDKQCSTAEYIDFINTYYQKYDIQRHEDLHYDQIERVVFNKDNYESKGLVFNPSLTPLNDNLKVLFDNGKLVQYNMDVLLRNYEGTSIDFLKTPRQYLTSQTEIVNSGANEDIKVEPIYHTPNPYRTSRNQVTCRLTKGAPHVPKVQSAFHMETSDVLNAFDAIHYEKFNETNNKSFNELGLSGLQYTKHYRPDRRYWLRLAVNIANMRNDEFNDYWVDFPFHFKLIVEECAKISYQSVKDLMVEFNYLEAYASYDHLFDEHFKYRDGKRRKKSGVSVSLMRLIKTAREQW